MNTRKKARLPNPPKSTRLTKKLAIESMRILDEIDRVLFDSHVLQMRGIFYALQNATGLEDPDPWVRDMHDRVIAARANLHAWREEEKRKAIVRNRRQMRDGKVGKPHGG